MFCAKIGPFGNHFYYGTFTAEGLGTRLCLPPGRPPQQVGVANKTRLGFTVYPWCAVSANFGSLFHLSGGNGTSVTLRTGVQQGISADFGFN